MATTAWTTTYELPDDEPVDPALVRRVTELIEADINAALMIGIPTNPPPPLNVDALVSAFKAGGDAFRKMGEEMGEAMDALVAFGISNAITEEQAALAEAALIAQENAHFGLDIELAIHQTPKPDPVPGARRIDFED